MFDFFTDGGPFMYVILLSSICALALFLERAFYLYVKLRLNEDKVFDSIHHHLKKSNYREAIEACNKHVKHPLGRTLKAGLLSAGRRDKDIELALQESLIREMPEFKKRINYLSMFANVATLLGLLGTITGLIAAFGGVAEANPAEKQEILASGISIAMLTTAFGLVAAIPSLMGFFLLTNKAEAMIASIEEKAFRLHNILCTLKQPTIKE